MRQEKASPWLNVVKKNQSILLSNVYLSFKLLVFIMTVTNCICIYFKYIVIQTQSQWQK